MHFSGRLLPTGQKEPIGQLMQWEDSDCPAEELKVPDGHGVEALLPALHSSPAVVRRGEAWCGVVWCGVMSVFVGG